MNDELLSNALEALKRAIERGGGAYVDSRYVPALVTEIERLLAEVKRLRADYANLEECYEDRDTDLQHEYDRANAAEKEVERLRAEAERERQYAFDAGKQAEDWQTERNVAVSDCDEWRTEVERLRSELAACQKELTELRKQHGKRFAELADVLNNLGSPEIAKIVRKWAAALAQAGGEGE